MKYVYKVSSFTAGSFFAQVAQLRIYTHVGAEKLSRPAFAFPGTYICRQILCGSATGLDPASQCGDWEEKAEG